MQTENTIVGGGPAGLYLTGKLKDSLLFDRKAQIGRPVQCTGILTKEIEKLLTKKELERCTVHKIYETKVIGPTKSTTIPLSTNYIICNTSFEEMLYDKALRQGAQIHLRERYVRSTKEGHTFMNLETKKEHIVKSPRLIGADGPNSEVNAQCTITKRKTHYIGAQVRLQVKEHENHIQFFPHIGVYAWYVPESETIARVGICVRQGEDALSLLDSFLKRFNGKIIERQGGFIPVYSPNRRSYKQFLHYDVTLLGDAAGQIKNTTGGGIIPALKAAKYFSESKAKKGSYNAQLHKELYSHFLVHNLLQSCSSKEWDFIISKGEEHAHILQSVDRDNLLQMMVPLLKDITLPLFGFKKVISGRVKLI